MTIITIKPLAWILIKKSIKDISINLGENFLEIVKQIWEPSSTNNNKRYYDKYLLQITVDDENNIEFIEISKDSVKAIVFDIDIFNTKAEDIIWILSQKYKVTTSERGDYFDFLELWLSFWRRFIPNLSKNQGENHGEEWLYFDTCSISKKGYLERLNSIT